MLIVTGALCAFGQTNTTTNAPDIQPADEGVRDFVAQFNYWKLLLVPLTMVLCAGVKHLVSSIPNKWIPVIGPIVGGLLDLAASKFGFWTGDVGAGAIMGATATWAHQFLTRVPQPQNPVPEPPKE